MGHILVGWRHIVRKIVSHETILENESFSGNAHTVSKKSFCA